MLERGTITKTHSYYCSVSGIIMLLPYVIQVLLQITCTNHVMELSLRDLLTSLT